MTTAALNTGDLKYLLNAVPKYPISAKNLLSIATRKRLPVEIINFYRKFPEITTFDSAEDVVARSEQVDILGHEMQPPEDTFRGAED